VKEDQPASQLKMLLNPEREFYDCCRFGDSMGVARFLSGGPDPDVVHVDLNACNPMFFGYTALHAACENGHLDIVQLLLRHQKVNVDVKVQKKLWTPFFLACWTGRHKVVEVMLQDPRIDVNSASVDGYTPLTIALVCANVQVVKVLLASGRILDFSVATNSKCREGAGRTVRELAYGNSEVLELLQRFSRNEAQVRWELQMELGQGGQHRSSFIVFFFSILL